MCYNSSKDGENMDILCRDYKEEDLDSVNEILKEAFDVTKDNFKHSDMKEIVALADDNVAGYLILTKVLNPIKDKYYYLVDYVCVSSKYRKMGISDALMEYAYKVASDDGAMYLQLTCSYKRVGAHKLYERCGYIKRDSDIYRKVIL